MEIRIGHLSTLYHTSMLMMARPGILKGFAAGIDWRLFGTGPAIVRAFDEGALDLAYIGLPPAIIGISKGLGLKCIAGGHVEGTVVAGRADALSYPETEDAGSILSNARAIGVPGRGSIHDIILGDLLQRRGSGSRVLNLPWADLVLEAFAKGRVDAAVGTPALAQAVVSFAGGKILCPPHLLWPDNPSCGIVAREDFLRENKPLIMDFLAVHESAATILRNGRESAAADIARLMGVVDERFVLEVLGISPRYCAALSPGFVDCAMRLAKRQKELGYIERDIRREEIFDFSLIREVHPGPDHYR